MLHCSNDLDMMGNSKIKSFVIAQLSAKLKGRPCRVFSSDVADSGTATGLVTYPDASIVCGSLQTDPEDANSIVNPSVIVEVLSPSTENYDQQKVRAL